MGLDSRVYLYSSVYVISGLSSRSCAIVRRWTRSAHSSRTAASWPSSAPTQCGMPDTRLTGLEAAFWSLDVKSNIFPTQWPNHSFNYLDSICIYDQAQLMLCHCIGGVIPGCGVIFDNSSDGYSCKHAAVCWKYYALYNKLVHSLAQKLIKKSNNLENVMQIKWSREK